MQQVPLAPGEREEASLHPAFASYLPWHLLGLVPALLGLALLGLFHSGFWASGSNGPGWKFWNYLYGNIVVAALLVLLLFGGAGALFAWRMRRKWPLPTLLLAGLAVVTLDQPLAGSYTTVVPVLLATLTLPAWLLAEVDRRSRTYHLTNLRLVARGGLLRRRDDKLHYDALRDLDWRRGPLARLFGHATLLPVPAQPKKGAKGASAPASAVRLHGLHPYPGIRDALEALIQRATAGPVMKEATGAERRAAEAIAGLGRGR
ncbi:MAG TPA: PH domain-containing protein [Candidatus Thermoplasmatota archaeon]|nr:PH domain-containing protein [Candidatus Thermoplasmatota archaeon]